MWWVQSSMGLMKNAWKIKIFSHNNCAPDSIQQPRLLEHDDVIKWKQFPRYWPFVRGIYRSPVNSPQQDQRRGALMFSLICAWTNGWVNNRGTSDFEIPSPSWWGHCKDYKGARVYMYVNATDDVNQWCKASTRPVGLLIHVM